MAWVIKEKLDNKRKQVILIALQAAGFKVSSSLLVDFSRDAYIALNYHDDNLVCYNTFRSDRKDQITYKEALKMCKTRINGRVDNKT